MADDRSQIQPVADSELMLAEARVRLAAEMAKPPLSPARYGYVAGFLIVAAVVAALPSYFFTEPRPNAFYWVIAAVAVGLGLCCMLVPWSRLPGITFHLLTGAGVLLVVAGTWVTGLHTEGFYAFIVVFAAFVLSSRRAVAAWVCVCGLAMLAPALWLVGMPDSVDRTFRVAVITFTLLTLIAIVIVHLKEQFEAERRRLYEFASDVIDLTERLDRARLATAAERRGAISAAASAARRRAESSPRSASG
jgi:hypothetical protein